VSDEKTAVKTAVSPLSGGRIPLGAHPGNTGGKKGRSGRPTSAVREACRAAFDKRIHLLKKIADGKLVADMAERLRAIDMLAKYGIGTTVTETDTEGNDVERPQVIAYIPTHARFLGN
jgi:hypothetical protein